MEGTADGGGEASLSLLDISSLNVIDKEKQRISLFFPIICAVAHHSAKDGIKGTADQG